MHLCLAGTGVEACTKCADGYLLEDWRCVLTCSPSYYLSEQTSDNGQVQRSCKKWVSTPANTSTPRWKGVVWGTTFQSVEINKEVSFASASANFQLKPNFSLRCYFLISLPALCISGFWDSSLKMGTYIWWNQNSAALHLYLKIQTG